MQLDCRSCPHAAMRSPQALAPPPANPHYCTAQGGAATGAFLPFLPIDNQDLTEPTTQEALAVTNEQLAELLRAPDPEFWRTVRDDRSLHTCLDSYLRFKGCVVCTIRQTR
jgi:hypothetical protein